jgi:hypothetical protein
MLVSHRRSPVDARHPATRANFGRTPGAERHLEPLEASTADSLPAAPRRVRDLRSLLAVAIASDLASPFCISITCAAGVDRIFRSRTSATSLDSLFRNLIHFTHRSLLFESQRRELCERVVSRPHRRRSPPKDAFVVCDASFTARLRLSLGAIKWKRLGASM